MQPQDPNAIKGDSNIVLHDIGNSQIVIHTHDQGQPAFPLRKDLTLRIPRTSPDEIIGRKADLEQLRQSLMAQRKVVLVNGLGGIGKTTLAQAYVEKYYDDYHHIAWISQQSENIANDFINTEGVLSCLGIDPSGSDSEQLFQRIIGQLKAISHQPNLLIIDNAEQSVKKYQDMLPGQPDWHVILTSREEIAGFHSQPLGFLSEEQSVLLFKKHYPYQQFSDQEISTLVRSVDHHTLTIEILAKTAAVHRYDFATLQEAVQRDLKASIEVPHNRNNSNIDRVGAYLRAVFNLSKLDETEIWVMKQFACLPVEFHNYALLRELIIDEEDSYASVFAETLSTLVRKGWILYDQQTDSYKMHRIIATIIRQEKPIMISDTNYFLKAVTKKLSLDIAKDNPIDKFVWIPYGKAVLSNFTDNTAKGIAVLQNNLALRIQDLGDYVNAKSLFEKSVPLYEKNYGIDHPNTAISYANLGLLLHDLGDYAEAKSMLERAVQSDEKNFGVDHPSTSRSSSNLALVLQDIGDYEGAKSLLERAVQSDEKSFGADHPNTATRYSNLAMVLQDLGDHAGAKVLLEKAMQSDEKTFGVDHPATSIRYSNLATVLQDMGDYEGAKSLLQRAVQSDEKSFGADHPTTAIRYSNLASVLADLGEYGQALQFSEKALSIFKKALPEEHPKIKKSNSVYQFIKDHIVSTSRSDHSPQ